MLIEARQLGGYVGGWVLDADGTRGWVAVQKAYPEGELYFPGSPILVIDAPFAGAVGRHAEEPGHQAPEVDGGVYLSHGPVQPGTLCTAHVVSATEYDLLAEAEPSAPVSATPSRRPR